MKAEKTEKSKYNYEEVIKQGFTNFGWTPDRSALTFREVILRDKNLDVITAAFTNYKNLMIMDLSENNFQDFSNLGPLPNLLVVNLRKNNIKDLKGMLVEENFPKLQKIDLSMNKIVELGPIKCPRLVELDLSDNRIEKTEAFEGHQKLEVLSLRKNRLATMTTLKNMPALRELYLAENKIKNFTGLEGLGALKTLHLRKNVIDLLDEELLASDVLEYLNLRENKIEKLEEIKKLKSLPKLKHLIYSFNPFILKYQEKYVYETVNSLPNLIRINKVHITVTVRKQAYEYAEGKYLKDLEDKRAAIRAQKEKERLAAEAEAAAQAQQEQ